MEFQKTAINIKNNQYSINMIKVILFEKYILLSLDIIGFYISFLLASFIRFSKTDPNYFFSAYSFLTLSIILCTFYIFNLYDDNHYLKKFGYIFEAILSLIISAFLIATVIYIIGPEVFEGRFLGRGIIFIQLLSLGSWICISRFFIYQWIRNKRNKYNWLAIGNTKELTFLNEDFNLKKHGGKISFLVDNQDNIQKSESIPVVGNLSDLSSQLKNSWCGIIISDIIKNNPKTIEALMIARLNGTIILNVADYYEAVLKKVPINYLQDTWFVSADGFNLLHGKFSYKFKFLVDIAFSCLLLIFTLPIMIITSILIKISSKGPCLYTQIRTGLNGQDYKIYKFRSMSVNSENNGAQWSSKNDPRINYIGKIIRKTRIDELPQLFNVLKGEMSLIGPRPERPEFNKKLEKDIPYYKLRHVVKPGITGWAQVLYPYGASVNDASEKLKYDLYYVKNYSVLLDFSIALKTIRIIIFGKGI